MARPTNRQELIDYCLRKLGEPVTKINVAPSQLDDRVDEALKYYWDYHYDGTEKTFYKYQVTAEDKLNRYITMPENIIGVTNVFNTSMSGSIGMFDIRYQMALNDMYTIAGQSIVPYYINKMQISLYEELLTGMVQLRFNRNSNHLYIDGNWDRYDVGQWMVIEAYSALDPDTFRDVWSDRWLLKYTTALIKRQWGQNLTKFTGVQLVGGTMFNGEKIYNDAEAEIEKLEDEMINTYSLPSSFLVG